MCAAINEERRFPIGRFQKSDDFSLEDVKKNIGELKKYPEQLRRVAGSLTPEQLATKTKPGNWSIAQVVNHVADSHMNMVIRVKLMLTEENPTIKPYHESLWAQLPDGRDTNIENSLSIIASVHQKLTGLLEQLPEEDFHKTYFHPEDQVKYSLANVCALYAWHGKHHLAFIEELINEKNRAL